MLFSGGMLILQHSRLAALDFFDHVDSHYGIDEEAPVPSDDTTIEIPVTAYEVTVHCCRIPWIHLVHLMSMA